MHIEHLETRDLQFQLRAVLFIQFVILSSRRVCFLAPGSPCDQIIDLKDLYCNALYLYCNALYCTAMQSIECRFMVSTLMDIYSQENESGKIIRRISD